MNTFESYNFTQEEWEHCIKVLNELKKDPFQNPDNPLLSGLITKVYKTAKKYKTKEAFLKAKTEDITAIKNTVISKQALENKTFYADYIKHKDTGFKTLNKPKGCYCCGNTFNQLHFFYNRLCPNCAEANYEQRFKTVDLKNRNVILTGGRVKVGFATALKLLRSEANVMLTTRFPASALENFKKETDYNVWQHKLTIYGLDLRNLKAVERFISYYKSEYNTLDILINNAAQTIKYDDNYYLPIVEKEQQLLLQYINEQRLIANETPVIEDVKLLANASENKDFEMNRFGQPVDERTKTSWNSTLEEVSMYELLEVNLINQISPYFMIKELTSLFKNSEYNQRFIINVTSSEGIFSYSNKTIFHPHTNMTKAALNMLTKTSGADYEKDNIYMYAVDVGWISTGAKEVLRKKQFEDGYIPPLDSVDGAARILYPIIETLNGNAILVGTLLKNYKVSPW
jgi:NAD(P)-dependent dehydrogenase (short-subunit alcohol dehydrogenase family)